MIICRKTTRGGLHVNRLPPGRQSHPASSPRVRTTTSDLRLPRVFWGARCHSRTYSPWNKQPNTDYVLSDSNIWSHKKHPQNEYRTNQPNDLVYYRLRDRKPPLEKTSNFFFF